MYAVHIISIHSKSIRNGLYSAVLGNVRKEKKKIKNLPSLEENKNIIGITV